MLLHLKIDLNPIFFKKYMTMYEEEPEQLLSRPIAAF